MAAKQLIFREAARDKIRRGVDALVEAAKVTLGPRGRTVMLEREFGRPRIVNSGVMVAKSVELEDRFENIGAPLLREVASRTSEMAGDGSTTAAVLAHAMIHEGLRHRTGGMNPMDRKRSIKHRLKPWWRSSGRWPGRARIRRRSRMWPPSRPTTTGRSANCWRAIDKVGREGAILIDDGSGLASELEVVERMQIDRGFLSPYFIHNALPPNAPPRRAWRARRVRSSSMAPARGSINTAG